MKRGRVPKLVPFLKSALLNNRFRNLRYIGHCQDIILFLPDARTLKDSSYEVILKCYEKVNNRRYVWKKDYSDAKQTLLNAIMNSEYLKKSRKSRNEIIFHFKPTNEISGQKHKIIKEECDFCTEAKEQKYLIIQKESWRAFYFEATEHKYGITEQEKMFTSASENNTSVPEISWNSYLDSLVPENYPLPSLCDDEFYANATEQKHEVVEQEKSATSLISQLPNCSDIGMSAELTENIPSDTEIGDFLNYCDEDVPWKQVQDLVAYVCPESESSMELGTLQAQETDGADQIMGHLPLAASNRVGLPQEFLMLQ